jgi:serine phosphatase RsbU (regulator of sigma subunit)
MMRMMRLVKNPMKAYGFEHRLLVFFLLLSVTPTVLIAIFGTHYFLAPVKRLSSPALRESFANSMEVARQLEARLEHDASTATEAIAEEIGARPAVRDAEAARRVLKSVTGKCRADFSALYAMDEGSARWTLVASFPSDLDRIDRTIEARDTTAALAPAKIAFTDEDLVAAGLKLGDDRLIVAGLALEAGTMDGMRKTSDDLSLYGSAGQWVSTMKIYIIIIFSVIVAITAVSSTVVSRLLARRISYPIQELALATDRIAGGDLKHRVTVKARDEIQSLISSFNNMTQELQDNKANLIAMAKREAQVARDFEIARKVQEDLFPNTLPDQAGWEFAATCRPAESVGGDYYDIFEVAPGKILFAQGDVSGKGLGASLVMASVHAIIRSWAGTRHTEPSRLISELNTYLVSSSAPETFVTLFLGVLDCQGGVVWYVNCGHPPVLVNCRSAGTMEELTAGGPILGVLSGHDYDTGRFTLVRRDSLVLVSDGVTEATNPEGDMFETERLLSTVRGDGSDRSAAHTMQNILNAVDEFAEGSQQADDISILVVRRTE